MSTTNPLMMREAINAMTEEPYKGKNQDTLQNAMTNNGWTNPRFITFHQAIQNGCHVMKGSRGTQISKFGKDDDDKTYVRTYTVFNVAQLGGKIPIDWLEGDLELYKAMSAEDLLTWPEEDLIKMANLARGHGDDTTARLIDNHIAQRDRYQDQAEKKLRRNTIDSYIDEEWVKAEKVCHRLVNDLGEAEGVHPRDLWRWTMNRARKYATEELLRYWTEHPRLTKKALMGDMVTRERQVKDSFLLI